MIRFNTRKICAIGEAMIEMAPIGQGLFRRGFAGDTFNTIWHMAQLLGDRAEVGFVTRVGSDPLSDAFVAEVAADGLDISGIGRDPIRAMGLYLIDLKGVERSFSYWRDTSAARLLADDPASLAASLTGAGLIHLSGITLAILTPVARANLIAALAQARQQGAVISFDPNVRPRLWAGPQDIRDAMTTAIAVTDIALPSFDDEAMLWGDVSPQATVARYAAAGVREIAVKNGASEVALANDAQVSQIATPVVTGIQDTTGAGDAFNAGYLAARMTGLTPERAVGAGQSLAGEVIRHFGARIPVGSMPKTL